MPNGMVSNICSRHPSRVGGTACWRCGRWSIPSFLSAMGASKGVCSPMSIRSGLVCPGISAHGATVVTGHAFTIPCAPGCAGRPVATSPPRPAVSIANASRPPTWVASVATIKANTCTAVHVTLVVATLGLLMAVVVTAASVSDPAGARLLLARLGGACQKLRLIWVDGTYRGQLVGWVAQHRRVVLRAV